MVVTQLSRTNRGSEAFGFTGTAILEAGGCVVATPPVSSDGPDPSEKQSLVHPESVNKAGGCVVATPPVSSDMLDRSD